MSKKIFDIYHPNNISHSIAETKEEISQKVSNKKIRKPKKTIALFLILLILISLGVSAYFLLPQAQIDIWPKTQVLDFQETAIVSVDQEKSDFLEKIFLGKIFEENIELSQTFVASGKVKKTERAQGQIRVFNAFSNNSQLLAINTRFISADGKLFMSLKAVIVPGGTNDEKGKLIPGFLDIEVMAAEPGDEYNIGPSTFSIPGFAGTVKYTAFYGKSSENMKGGFVGESFQVIESDIDKAKNLLKKDILEKGLIALKNKIPSDFVILEGALSQEIIEENFSASTGDEVENFDFTVKANLKILSFKDSELDNFIKEFITFEVNKDSQYFKKEGEVEGSFWSKIKTQDQSLQLNTSLNSINWEEKKIILDLNFSGKIYPDINKNFIRKLILSKSKKEVFSILSDQFYIDKVTINLWPFWVNNVPTKEDRVNIDLIL